MSELSQNTLSQGGDVEPSEETAGGDWQRLSPLSIVVGLLQSIKSALIPAGILLYSVSQDSDVSDSRSLIIPVFSVVLPLLAVFITGLIWLSWRRKRYRIGAQDVQFEEGLLSRSARSLPFERIQDVSLEQKLIPRLLGLVEVRFETGAGGKDELKFTYVKQAEGEALRETVRARGEGEAVAAGFAQALSENPQEIAVQTDESAGETLFAMNFRRLFTFGLFEFSLVIFAVAFGAAQQFDFVLPWSIDDIADLWKQPIENRLEESSHWLGGLSIVGQILGAIGALLGVAALGVVTGLGRTILRDYDFLLERTAKGFRRRRGLLTKTDVVMPVHRVQAVSVKTGWMRKIWGWHGLSFISLAQDKGASNHDVAPFAKLREIAPIAQAAGFALPKKDTDWQRLSANYFTDRAVAAIVFFTAIAVGLIAFDLEWFGIAAAIMGAAKAVREMFLWRYDRFALDGKQLVTRRGWLSPSTKIAMREKLHSATISQGPIARWRGYASLDLGLAGGTFSFTGLPLDEARRLRSEVLASMAAMDFSQLPR